MTGHRPFSELSDGLRRRLADRDAERQRIWAAIQGWTEQASKIGDDGQPVPIGMSFKPLAPFFDELKVMIFGDDSGRDRALGIASEELGFPDWYVDTEADLTLECVRCGTSVPEGYRRNELDESFWCSKKCMAADGHDATNAYATVTELGDEIPGDDHE